MTAYRVQVWTMDSSAAFAPGTLIAEFEKAMNVGWGDYLLDVPEAFFTLAQNDPKVSLLQPYKRAAHVKIYRDSTLVWGGILGEWSANDQDVIFYCYGYLALYYLLHSDWNVVYTNEQVDTIVSTETSIARGLTNSIAGWTSAGTIEAPVTTSGGATAIVLPTYKLFYKRILYALRELASLGIGDTTNTVVFEVTPTGVFNFWKNRGTDVDVTYRYGDGALAGFSEQNVPIFRRNDIFAVGVNPNSVTLKQEVHDTSDSGSYGRRMEPMFFSWVRDSVELDRVVKLRANKAKRDAVDIGLRFHPDSIIPPGGSGALFRLSDRINISIDHGATLLSGRHLVKGVQVLYMGGQERTRLLLEQRSGS